MRPRVMLRTKRPQQSCFLFLESRTSLKQGHLSESNVSGVARNQDDIDKLRMAAGLSNRDQLWA